MTALPCSEFGCRRITKSSSGRCYAHRFSRRRTATIGGEKVRLIGRPAISRPPGTQEDHVDDQGRSHRVGAPAWISFREDGTKRSEAWSINGEFSRLDGPALISYNHDGTVKTERFYVCGMTAPTPEGIKEIILGLPRPELTRAIETSTYAVLLAEGRDVNEIRDALCSGVRTVDGMREVFAGSPAEWVRAYEESREG